MMRLQQSFRLVCHVLFFMLTLAAKGNTLADILECLKKDCCECCLVQNDFFYEYHAKSLRDGGRKMSRANRSSSKEIVDLLAFIPYHNNDYQLMRTEMF